MKHKSQNFDLIFYHYFISTAENYGIKCFKFSTVFIKHLQELGIKFSFYTNNVLQKFRLISHLDL